MAAEERRIEEQVSKALRCHLQQLLRCQFLYFCTSKASKLSSKPSTSTLRSRRSVKMTRDCISCGVARRTKAARSGRSASLLCRSTHSFAAYVSIRQHTSASVRPLEAGTQHTPAYVSIRQHTSASVSIRQHTSACTPAGAARRACSQIERTRASILKG